MTVIKAGWLNLWIDAVAEVHIIMSFLIALNVYDSESDKAMQDLK